MLRACADCGELWGTYSNVARTRLERLVWLDAQYRLKGPATQVRPHHCCYTTKPLIAARPEYEAAFLIGGWRAAYDLWRASQTHGASP